MTDWVLPGDPEWTPTTDEVREGFATDDMRYHSGYADGFDRWLEAHDAEIRAEAREAE